MEATVAQQVWRDGLGERAGLVARCFPRRETRAMLMGVAQANCWTLAEALGHGDPHRLQNFLARAVWNHDAVRDRAARWVAHQLADDQAVLVVDETGDEKSSTDAADAGRQYCGVLGAQDQGGSGYDIIGLITDPPRLDRKYVRDEALQARELTETLAIFDDARVDGALRPHVHPAAQRVQRRPEVRLRHGQLQPGQELRDRDRRPGRAVPRHPPGT